MKFRWNSNVINKYFLCIKFKKKFILSKERESCGLQRLKFSILNRKHFFLKSFFAIKN